MKNAKKVLACGLGLSLLFAQGFTTAEAKGKPEKNKVADKNKNGIADNWEKKYKLSGKNIAAQDNDKDGLNNLWEYKLNLDPQKADSNNNGVADGQEDFDKDGLGNLSEGDFGFNPTNPDTDRDQMKDGDEKSKDGVKFSDKVRELEIEIKTADKKKVEIEYEVKKGKPHIKIKAKSHTVTKEIVTSLVNELQDPANATEEQVMAKLQSLLKLEGSFSIEFEIEYADGTELEFEKEIKAGEGKPTNPTDEEDEEREND